MRQVIRGLGRLEDAAGILAAIVMFLIMVIATTDVMLRYVFNSPFSWSYDFNGLYLMTALFYLGLSGTLAHYEPDIGRGSGGRRVGSLVVSSGGAVLTKKKNNE